MTRSYQHELLSPTTIYLKISNKNEIKPCFGAAALSTVQLPASQHQHCSQCHRAQARLSPGATSSSQATGGSRPHLSMAVPCQGTLRVALADTTAPSPSLPVGHCSRQGDVLEHVVQREHAEGDLLIGRALPILIKTGKSNGWATRDGKLAVGQLHVSQV